MRYAPVRFARRLRAAHLRADEVGEPQVLAVLADGVLVREVVPAELLRGAAVELAAARRLARVELGEGRVGEEAKSARDASDAAAARRTFSPRREESESDESAAASSRAETAEGRPRARRAGGARDARAARARAGRGGGGRENA